MKWLGAAPALCFRKAPGSDVGGMSNWGHPSDPDRPSQVDRFEFTLGLWRGQRSAKSAGRISWDQLIGHREAET